MSSERPTAHQGAFSFDTRTSSLPLSGGGRLDVSITPVNDALTFGNIDLTVGGQTIGAHFSLPQGAAEQFVAELVELRAGRSDAASIRDHRGKAELVITAREPKSDGLLAISGHFVKEPTIDTSVTVRIDHHYADRADLPGFIEGLIEPPTTMTDVRYAVRILRSGGLVAFPTETVYGLGADATNADAVRKIFAAKGRPATNPLIVHVADIDTAKRYAAVWSDAAQTLAAVWWPGPLTLVLPKAASIVDEATAGRATVGLRVPDHPVALELLRAFGGPVAAPSANRSNRVSPTAAAHVREELGDAVDLILDGGPCAVGIESTVLDLTGATPVILRPGGVSRAQIEGIVGGPVEVFAGSVAHDVAAASPGQMPVHYAPRTPAYRFETSQRGLVQIGTDDAPRGLVVLSPLKIFKKYGRIIALPNDPAEYAKHLYAVLRELDGMGLVSMAIEIPPDRPEWAAIRDRIIRSTQPLPVA